MSDLERQIIEEIARCSGPPPDHMIINPYCLKLLLRLDVRLPKREWNKDFDMSEALEWKCRKDMRRSFMSRKKRRGWA